MASRPLFLLAASLQLVGAAHAAVPASPAAPNSPYWKLLAPQLVDTYAVVCTRPLQSGSAQLPATLVIEANGKFRFNAIPGNLFASEQSLLVRKREANGTYATTFTSGSGPGALTLAVKTGPGYRLSFQETAADTTICEGAAGAALKLNGPPLYTMFASVLQAQGATLPCRRPGSSATAMLPYRFENGVIQIGAHKFDLAAMTEMADLSRGFSGLRYGANRNNEDSITVAFDSRGKLYMAMGTDHTGPVFSCMKE